MEAVAGSVLKEGCMSKNQWRGLIIFAFILFIYSMIQHQIVLTAIALVIGILVSRQNIFKEYDEKQEAKRRYYSNIIKKYREEKSKEKSLSKE